MILALLSYWRQPIEISRSTDRRQLGIMLPIGVMIKDPLGGGDASTLNGQDGAYYLSRVNHTGTQDASTIAGLATVATSGSYNDLSNKPTISTDAQTLNGQNGTYYLDRSNHTGTQAISTIDNLQDALDLKLDAADYNDRFLGLYASFYDLDAAHPTASAGDYAQVDLGIGSDVIIYAWDVSDNQWASVGSSAIANTDALPEGSSNLYFTTQRVRDTTITGFSSTNSTITSTDTVVQAFGKAQGQINAKQNALPSGTASQYLNGNQVYATIDYSQIENRITNTDGLTEGIANLYFTNARVRSTALTGLSATNSPIIATDTVLQGFGKAQGQIDAFAVNSEKTLLHRTLTKFYERKNSGNLSPFDINLRGLFETNYIIPANTLTAGDSFRIEFEIFFYSVTGQAGNYGFAPIINGATVPLSAEGQVTLGILTTHQHIRGHVDFTCYSTGLSGVFGFDGYAQGRNGTIYPYTQTPATYNTTADITVNMSARFTSAPSGANTARVVFGRLYKISN